MKGEDIKVGGTYAAKVSGKIVPLRVVERFERRSTRGRKPCLVYAWKCVNIQTGREVVVKSPQRFRHEWSQWSPTLQAVAG